MFGLVDGNNFYASCERVFQPKLRGVPLVVLSNNDGCAIARSAEAKVLGIKMGQPAHELRHLVRRHGLQMRSANFGLYGDMSARVVSILREAAPRVEVYSIDESFIDLTGVPGRKDFARELRTRVHRWTGIPNCIGIGPTRRWQSLPTRRRRPARAWWISATGRPVMPCCRNFQWKTSGALAGAWRRSWWRWASAPRPTSETRQRTTSSPSSG